MGKYTKNQSFKEMSVLLLLLLLLFCFFVYLFFFFFFHIIFFFSQHRGRISSVGRALDCRAGVLGFVSRDGTNTQGLKNNLEK